MQYLTFLKLIKTSSTKRYENNDNINEVGNKRSTLESNLESTLVESKCIKNGIRYKDSNGEWISIDCPKGKKCSINNEGDAVCELPIKNHVKGKLSGGVDDVGGVDMTLIVVNQLSDKNKYPNKNDVSNSKKKSKIKTLVDLGYNYNDNEEVEDSDAKDLKKILNDRKRRYQKLKKKKLIDKEKEDENEKSILKPTDSDQEKIPNNNKENSDLVDKLKNLIENITVKHITETLTVKTAPTEIKLEYVGNDSSKPETAVFSTQNNQNDAENQSMGENKPNNPSGNSGGQPNNPSSNSGGQPNNPSSNSGGQPNNPSGNSGGQPNNPSGNSGGQPNNPSGNSGSQPSNNAGRKSNDSSKGSLNDSSNGSPNSSQASKTPTQDKQTNPSSDKKSSDSSKATPNSSTDSNPSSKDKMANSSSDKKDSSSTSSTSKSSSSGIGSGNIISNDDLKAAMVKSGFKPNDEYLKIICENVNKDFNDKPMAAQFLAQLAHESGGYIYVEEEKCKGNKCPGEYGTGASGKQYYGRGFIQLSWPDNYTAASKDLFSDTSLYDDPDKVAKDPKIGYDVSSWYWKTRVANAEGVGVDNFGFTTKAINGELECKGQNVDKSKKRYEIYKNIAEIMNLEKIASEKGCYN